MKHKKLVMTLTSATLVMAYATQAQASACSANATKTFTIGQLPNFYITSGTPYSPSITANFGNGYSAATSFDDCYTFTIPTQSGMGSGSISTSFSNGVNLLTITELLINGKSYTVPSNGMGQYVAENGIPITAGVLNSIEVIGTTSSMGGTYSGTATFFTSAPEPASWALMLGGFGMIGGAMRSRKKAAITFS